MLRKNNLRNVIIKSETTAKASDSSATLLHVDVNHMPFTMISNGEMNTFSSIPANSIPEASNMLVSLISQEELESQLVLIKTECDEYTTVAMENSNNFDNFKNYAPEYITCSGTTQAFVDDNTDLCETVVVETFTDGNTDAEEDLCVDDYRSCNQNIRDIRCLTDNIESQNTDAIEDFDISTEVFDEMKKQSDESKPSSRLKRYQCNYCDQFFSRAGSLQRHLSTHTNSKSRSGNRRVDIILDDSSGTFQVSGDGDRKCVYECSQCSKFFTQRSTLVRHQRTHNGERPFMCAYCFKSFVQLVHLRRHTESAHSADGWQHQCKTCGRKFSRVESLSVHERIHSGELPYTCETCGKTFRHLSSCRLHELTHTGVLPYTCAHCEHTFSSATMLKSHQRSHSECERDSGEMGFCRREQQLTN